MKKIVLVIILSMISGAALAQGGKNMSECAKLLPKDNKHYNLTIDAFISKTRNVHGNFFISDDSNKNPPPDKVKEKLKTMMPFNDCVGKLME